MEKLDTVDEAIAKARKWNLDMAANADGKDAELFHRMLAEMSPVLMAECVRAFKRGIEGAEAFAGGMNALATLVADLITNLERNFGVEIGFDAARFEEWVSYARHNGETLASVPTRREHS